MLCEQKQNSKALTIILVGVFALNYAWNKEEKLAVNKKNISLKTVKC